MEQPAFDNFDDGGHIDPRSFRARDLFDKHPDGVVRVHSTTRSGVTRSIIEEGRKRGEKTVVLEPYNSILDGTVRYSVDNDSFRKVCKNVTGICNQELCEKYPDLKALETLPLPEVCGERCEHFHECDVPGPVRDGWDVCGVTYHKLMALEASQYGKTQTDDEPTMANRLLEELLMADNFILDEVHALASGDRKEREVARFKEADEHKSAIERLTEEEANKIYDHFETIQTPFPMLHQIAVQFGSLLEDTDIRDTMNTVAERAIKKAKSERWSITTENRRKLPHQTEAVSMVKRDLVKLMLHRKEYGLSVGDVIFLEQAHWIMISQKIAITAKRTSRDDIVVNIHALDTGLQMFIQSFFKRVSWEAHERNESRRMLLTTATFPDHDFRQYFWKGSKFGDYIWGDPMHTNSKLLVLCDTKRHQTWGERHTDWHKFVEFIYDIVTEYGAENVAVVAINAQQAEILQRLSRVEVTYYRSDKAVGSDSDRRILIALGAGYVPANTFDPVAKDNEDSKRMMLEAMRIATANAFGIPKDSWGGGRSIIFALEITRKECEDIFAWGAGRKLEGEDYRPKCEIGISKPEIVRCEDWNVMKERARHHLKANYRERMKMKKEKLRGEWGGLWKKYCAEKSGHVSKYINDEPLDKNPAASLEISTAGEAKKPLSIVINNNISGFSGSPAGVFYDDVDASLTLSASKIYLDFQNKYTYDSLTASCAHFLQNMQKVFVSSRKKYTDIYTFLEEPFMPRFDYWNSVVARYGEPGKVDFAPFYAKSETIAKRVFFTWLDAHVRGTRALIISPLDKFSCGIWGCFDVDAHPQQKKDSGVTFRKKRLEAELKVGMLCATMVDYGIPFLLEQSGSPSSFHIWLFFERCGGKLIRSFMESIAREAGVEGIEINPKQVTHNSKKRAGNGVRIPFGTHQGHFGKSKILVDDKWVSRSEFKEVVIETIDISQFDPDIPALTRIGKAPADTGIDVPDYPEPEIILDGTGYCACEYVECVGGESEYPGVRRFYSWSLTQELTGEEGHKCRLYDVREFLNAGWAVEDIARLFEHQSDYDYEISLKAVKEIAKTKCKNVKYATLRRDCPLLVAKFEDETGHSLSSSTASAC